ncbi:hypothetical protein VNO78_07474 [Psophocarpus tetragonolobus]|uniref:Gnk2-homologous domain-containing protein n=1 Tax=Psophocarpus tetragonolobus TaxID=3891 RepID=A0AAN9XSF5_PSOTE
MIHSLMVPKPIQVYLFCTLTLFSGVVFAKPPYNICSTSSSYVDGSSFENNLMNLLSSLSSNASISKFYNTSYGVAPDRVYGLYMCLGYTTTDSCQKCIMEATKDIVKLCPKAKEAVLWEEMCQLRYSNTNFLGRLNVTGNIGLNNKQNISEPEKFESAVNDILSYLTMLASFDASTNKYVSAEIPFENKTVFAVVQCTRDLTTNDCSTCLQSAMRDIPGCCYTYIGARVLSRSCYLRYELYQFPLGATETKDSSTRNNAPKRGKEIDKNGIDNHQINLQNFGQRGEAVFHQQKFRGRNKKTFGDFPCIDLATLCVATKNFSDLNKLGQGGFGSVYKGILNDGQEVAIKRLSTWIVAGSEGEANTATIVGTYGYMSPEYAMEGLYSIKSDVFGFGVLLLETITGKRNTSFNQSQNSPSLLSYNESAKPGQPERPPFSLGRSNANEPDFQECSLNLLTISHILPQ